MSEMVERIAQVIGDQMAADANSNEDIARAVLDAAREPTMHMMQEAGDTVVVGCCNLQLRDAEETWKVMIDAALKDSSHDG